MRKYRTEHTATEYTSCCSIDSKRSHRYCRLRNKVESIDRRWIFLILYNRPGDAHNKFFNTSPSPLTSYCTVPWTNLSPYFKRHLYRSFVSVRLALVSTHRHTHRPRNIGNNRPHAMRPNIIM